ncbi:MAG: hypothetical protein EOO90_03835 [Pedobacter sp.]|nr:MAG: hypothetical protein EOO90_03835 [Pedobacter sp.]
MNRLVLIGNGFDLAHGLKTSYNDFILWYLKKCFKTADLQINYADQLLEISLPYMNMQGLGRDGFNNTEELFNELYQNDDLYAFMTAQPLHDNYKRFEIPYSITLCSTFFKKLLRDCRQMSWVEIENHYYKELKRCLNMGDRNFQKQKLDELNHHFKFLIVELEAYLKTLEVPAPIPAYTELLAHPILPDEILNIDITEEIVRLKTMVLNFNYTSTAEHYLEAKHHTHTGQTYAINYIHGKIEDTENPLVFGFGDELDEDYLKMEKSKVKGFFRHIKSFWYFRTENYHNLVRFLQDDQFQVYVLGHSCGLSDRTLLNMIFEHPNCMSIKIHYHGTKEANNFTSLTEEISRHFKNKVQMRDKIMPLTSSSRMPQHDD